jgi:hypothetical protein
MEMASSSSVRGMNWKKCVGRSGRSFVVAQEKEAYGWNWKKLLQNKKFMGRSGRRNFLIAEVESGGWSVMGDGHHHHHHLTFFTTSSG